MGNKKMFMIENNLMTGSGGRGGGGKYTGDESFLTLEEIVGFRFMILLYSYLALPIICNGSAGEGEFVVISLLETILIFSSYNFIY